MYVVDGKNGVVVSGTNAGYSAWEGACHGSYPSSLSPGVYSRQQAEGKVPLVSGGGSGIGIAVCQCFAMEGATVVFSYVKGQEDKDYQDTLKIIKSNKTSDAKDPIGIPTDLGYDNNCKQVVDEVIKAFGHIDVLVNNCAEQYESAIVEEIDDPRLERVFINIFS